MPYRSPPRRGAYPRPDTTSSSDEQSLVRGVRNGDADAFRVVFDRYVPDLCDYVWSLVRSREVAEDLVHEVLLAIWRDRARWEVREGIRPYLVSAVRNRALNHLRQERTAAQWRERAVAAVREPAADPGRRHEWQADDLLADRGQRAALADAIAALPVRCAHVFGLRWERGLSYLEIAQILRISPRTVENQLARALRLLRDRLRDWR